ncbi:hypothetical protein QNH10_18810 [Sporosarcina thermotolerans]|uniref:hypothetical protein n=1 Tax=Sporosarcina thermotolerans TaxID=633404 RepID=UPI0024BC870F|nr:hypothetical protein [Sporosarcina thermotolerans]WHT48063.1 hypothetical protein QNH10_18810 [Sporosarcina thermotolerans]
MRRIVFLIVMCCLLLMGTSIYAQSTQGTTFSDWYRHQFHLLSNQLSEEMNISLTTFETSVNTYQEQLLKRMESRLVDYVLNASEDANHDIKNYKNNHLQQLNETKKSLMEKDLIEIEKEMKKRQMEIDRRTFDILSELLSEYGFDGITSDVKLENNHNKTEGDN